MSDQEYRKTHDKSGLMFELCAEEKAQLRELAQVEGRSMTNLIKWWIRQEWLKLHPEKQQISLEEELNRL